MIVAFQLSFHSYIACAGSSGREGRPPRPARGPPGGRGRQADAAALAAAAASLNTFKGDGTFLESFQQAAAGKQLTDTCTVPPQPMRYNWTCRGES